MNRRPRSIAAIIALAAVVVGGCGRDTASRTSEQPAPTVARNPPSAADATPSGEEMPVGDLPGWRQVFVDDFTTDVARGRFPAAVAARWGGTYPDGWPDTTGNGVYSPSKVVSIAQGVMRLHIHTDGGRHLVAAPVPTIPHADGPGGGVLYGRFAVRFRSARLPGYKTAWLLWPDSKQWPRDGEIDFPEGDLDGVIKAYLHPQGGTTGDHSARFVTSSRYTSWHTAVIEWLPGSVTFLLDGRRIGSVTDRVPQTPMHWVLQTETAIGGPPPRDGVRGDVEIDWVAVYRPSDG